MSKNSKQFRKLEQKRIHSVARKQKRARSQVK